MRFLVDAQLPRRMCGWLAGFGHEACHTPDLPSGNRTPDGVLIAEADRRGAVLVTKDDDFVQSRLLNGKPRLLWLVATGNIDNRELESLVRRALPQIVAAFAANGFVELGSSHLTVRD